MEYPWANSTTFPFTENLACCCSGDLPRLYLPPLTEATGDWYADLATAEAVLADPLQVGSTLAGCVAFTEGAAGLTTFFVDGGFTDITLSTTFSSAVASGAPVWVSVNAESGDTLRFDFSVSAGSRHLVAEIYDEDGLLVESISTGTSPANSSALPYTGRYTVKTVVSTDSSSADFTCLISGSGTISFNIVRALYDIGGATPRYVECGGEGGGPRDP